MTVEQANDAVIEARSVTKVFTSSAGGVRNAFSSSSVIAVDDVWIRVNRGETVAVVGESGCGKSTLARVVLGLEKPTSGEVLFRGMPISQMGRRDRRAFRSGVQAVFQDPYASLNPRMKVKDIICEPLDIQQKLSRDQTRERVASLLERVGLESEAGGRYPHQFSGGQRQRIAIARALSVSPEVIVLDEPVSALDVSVRAQTLNLLNDLQSEFGVSYLFISHDLAVVAHIAARVVVMYLGQVVEEGSIEAVFSSPKHPYTRALLQAVPQPTTDKRLVDGRVGIVGEISSADAMPPGCRFHPRCPMAVASCRRVEPVLASDGLTSVRCLLYEGSRPREGVERAEVWPRIELESPEPNTESRVNRDRLGSE